MIEAKLKKLWEENSKDAIAHWGELKSEPLDADFTSLDNFKEFLIGQYGWDYDTANEELKWFSDFTRTFEGK